jgi:glycosyltransferase involved in cell wall biosynthesis
MNFRNKQGISFSNELDLRSYLYLYKLLKIIKPDIIQVHEAHGLSLVAFATFKTNIPIVSTRRVDSPIKNHLLNKFKYKNCNIKKWIAISNSVRKSLIDFGINSEKILNIYSAAGNTNYNINNDELNSLRSIYKHNDNILIGSILSFVHHKDPFTLIKTFDLLYKKYKKVKLLILGEGGLKEKIIKIVNTFESKNNIIIIGFKENIYDYLSLFDIFIITSKREALCSSIIDALSMGKPVVATRTGGIPEIVRDNYNGFLNEVEDIEGLSNSLLKLILDKKLYRSMSQNAYNSSQQFREDMLVNKYINLYKEVLYEKRKT